MISTKGRYALRVMIDLSQHSSEEYIPLHDVAKRQQISEKYLEIIIKLLVKNKFVKGLRGKGGGYRLTKEPSSYSVYEILECTEDSLAPVACLSKNADICPRKDGCKTIGLWEGYNKLTYDYFSNIYLSDLL